MHTNSPVSIFCFFAITTFSLHSHFCFVFREFSSHLIKLVEATDDTWPHIWSFVISLIVHDEQVHGVAINSLLKVVEIAFKVRCLKYF